MRTLLLTCTAFTLIGCAAQSPESQLQRKDTVRVCQHASCVEQDASKVTFEAQPVDEESARRLQALTELAENDPRAAHDLSLRLFRGDGVQRNSYQAIQWLRKAGDAGLMDAQLGLGQLYLNGFEEMGPDPSEAQAWLSRAASQGSKEAQQLLPQAQAARNVEHARYRAREAMRTQWAPWYLSARYYWYWRGARWYLH
ncbi:tetratricopeptide repeat protein [Pseudomonas sp. OIL-1]|uniref:tetratricopeptide repeat protein n=1 Tax=Pseudomonas sp. OIL-1 TaxID=2706126 RepID=UPI0021145940|nr:tetratricopeptide repeat protein [Pseudomonas sp. OIL-1]